MPVPPSWCPSKMSWILNSEEIRQVQVTTQSRWSVTWPRKKANQVSTVLVHAWFWSKSSSSVPASVQMWPMSVLWKNLQPCVPTTPQILSVPWKVTCTRSRTSSCTWNLRLWLHQWPTSASRPVSSHAMLSLRKGLLPILEPSSYCHMIPRHFKVSSWVHTLLLAIITSRNWIQL